MTHNRPAVIFVLAVVLMDVLAMGIVIPVLPKLVEQFMDGNTANAARIYGVFGVAWALMQFVFSPFIGALSDRFGRRRVLLISCTGLGLDYILMALAPNLWWLFIGRIISGITAASFSTAGAYIADVTPTEKRAHAFGMMGAAFGIGFVIGPALGGLLGGIDLHLPFWVAAALALLNALYGFFVMPESLPPEKRDKFRWAKANPIGALSLLRSHPELFGLAGVMTLNSLAHFVLPSCFVLYASYRYHWDMQMVGLSLALFGVGSAIVQGTLAGRFVKKFGERTAVLTGLTCGALGFTAFALAPTGAWFLLGAPVFSLLGMFGPAAQSIMSHHVSAEEQGKLQGANSSIMGVTGLIAPLMFTQVFAFFIADAHAGLHFPGAPFALAALLMVLALWLGARVTSHRKTSHRRL